MYENIEVGMYLNVFAGITYVGEITEIEKHGFWITENKRTEEFISYADVIEIKNHSRAIKAVTRVKSDSKHEH